MRKLLLLAGQAGDVHLVDLVVIAGIQARDDLCLHIDIMSEFRETAVRRLAETGVVNLQSPGHSFLLAFVYKTDDLVLGKRSDAVEYIVDRDAVTAVAHHVGEAQFVHIVYGHSLKTSCRNTQKMAGLAAFLKGPLRGFRYISVAVTARRQCSVYVKKQISLSSHLAPQLSDLCGIQSQYILF